jgi:hypothetical protein
MPYLAEVFAPPELTSTNREWHEADILERVNNLLSRPNELQHLVKDRGLSLSTIRRFKIGLFGPGVYMVPVYDDQGHLKNVRYYRMKDHKKWGVKGKTTKMLYPLLGMNGANPLWVCEGEFDAMMAIQHDIHAITTTAGAPATPATLNEYRSVFGDERKFILAFDNDDPGYKAAAEIGLDVFPGRIEGIVRWPPEFKKDISDWFNQGHTSEELQALVVPFNESWARDLTGRNGELPLLAAAEPKKDEPKSKGPIIFDLKTMWPESGFLRDYVDFAASVTDAPDQFHAGTALTVLGTATQRRIYYQMGINKLYPNFFTALVAPSSVYRKSTSIKIGGSITHYYKPGLIFPREFSTERFLLHLAKTSSQGLFYFSELAELLDQFKRSYAEGILALLTDFYDCPSKYERETQKDGLQVINDVYISILGASTVDWLNKNMSQDQSEGGFWPRFLFWPARERKPLMEIPPEPDDLKKNTLVYQLKELEGVAGKVILTDPAEALYRSWCRKSDQSAMRHPLGPSFIKYLSRMQSYAIKIAMLFEVSETKGLDISEVAMQKALALVDWLVDELAYMFVHDIAADRRMAKEQQLMRVVRDRPGITKRDALRAMHIPAKEFDGLVDSLKAKEYVEVLTKKGTTGRPSIVLMPGQV